LLPFAVQNLRRFMMLCVLVGTLSQGSVAFAAAAPGVQVADLAQQLIGSPYVWGGSSPAGFDCTGFVMWVFGQFNVSLPHNEAGQLQSGEAISADKLLPGDVLVFANTYRRGLSHVGLYLGDGRFVHAVDEAHGVMVNDLWDDYWGPRFVGASRPIPDAMPVKVSISR
jgi:cell wall-associated NlpC family hydrolase